MSVVYLYIVCKYTNTRININKNLQFSTRLLVQTVTFLCIYIYIKICAFQKTKKLSLSTKQSKITVVLMSSEVGENGLK